MPIAHAAECLNCHFWLHDVAVLTYFPLLQADLLLPSHSGGTCLRPALACLPFSYALVCPLLCGLSARTKELLAQECSIEGFLFPTSLTKDMTGKDDNYRGPAVRALCQITDVSAAFPLGQPYTVYPNPLHLLYHTPRRFSISAVVSFSLQSTMLQAIERYMKQAIVDKVPSVSSSALVSSLVGVPAGWA